MPDEIKALVHLGSMYGASKPQLVQGSDGKKYVLKLIGNPHGTRVLANEYVIGRLAKILDVPSPPVDIIHVDQSFVNVVNGATKHTFRPGPAFGSLCIGGENVQVVPSNSKDMLATGNAGKWPNAIVLDALVENIDLRPWQILITKNLSSRSSEFWHIDHEFCLGSYQGWNSLTNADVCVREPLLYPELVSGSKPFEEAFQKLREITRERVDGILEDLPLSEWEIPTSDVSALRDYLERAKDATPNAIMSAKRRFAKWA